MCTRAQFLSRVWFFATPWTVDHQALLSMVLSIQATTLGELPFPLPGGLPDPGLSSCLVQLSHWQADSLTLSHLGNHAMTGFLNPSWHLLVVRKNNKNNNKTMSLGKKEQEEIWHWNDSTKNRVPFPFHCFKCKKPFVSYEINYFSSVQFSRLVVSDSLWPKNCPTPGFPVHHQLPEFTQTQVHWVGDAIKPSHPLLSPSPPAPNPSQHQSLYQWVNSSHEMAKLLEFQL